MLRDTVLHDFAAYLSGVVSIRYPFSVRITHKASSMSFDRAGKWK